MDEKKTKELGIIYTPRSIARFLVHWAIRKPSDKVLDACAGEGVFLEEAFNRLLELGASSLQANAQIYGVEYDSETYKTLIKNVLRVFGHTPINVYNEDFFNIVPKKEQMPYLEGRLAIPLVDAVVGNPPYVERQRLKDVKLIRDKVLKFSDKGLWLSALTDIYGYFIIHSSRFLNSSGRLAFIISDTWLSMRFGKKLKDYLLSNFKIKAIVGFGERVFSEALVRAILLLLEKGTQQEITENKTYFINLKNGTLLSFLPKILNSSSVQEEEEKIQTFLIPQKELDPLEAWTIYLKAPKIYFKIIRNPLIVPLGELAWTAIGIQTLAKNFYILHVSELTELGLEKEYFRRVAVSPRNTPLIIEKPEDVEYFILYCDEPKEKLQDTRLLHYIEEGEKKKVRIRGKSQYVIGYQNVPRLKKARREPWYNLKTNLDRCERAPILIPRRIYERYTCVWNKAQVIENENFIRIYPRNPNFLFPLLAFMNSTLCEFVIRMRAHMYGGGVYDLRPYDVAKLPVPNFAKLNRQVLEDLANQYARFVLQGNRSEIDWLVYNILGLNYSEVKEISEKLFELINLSRISKG